MFRKKEKDLFWKKIENDLAYEDKVGGLVEKAIRTKRKKDILAADKELEKGL